MKKKTVISKPCIKIEERTLSDFDKKIKQALEFNPKKKK